MEEVTDA